MPRNSDHSRVLAALGLPEPLQPSAASKPQSDVKTRVWLHVARALRAAPARRGASPRARLVATVATIVMALALLVGVVTDRPKGAVQAGRLVTRSGQPFVVLEPKGGAQTLEFGDGSTITAEAGTRVVPLAASEREVVLELSRGTAHFSIRPSGPVRWVIETGNASVEVVGTVFSVVRTPDRVDVRVSRGAVLVRSEGLETRVRRLDVGGRLSLPVSSRKASSIGTREHISNQSVGKNAPQSSEPIVAPQGRSNAPGSVASGGASSKAERSLSADALLDRADQARLASDPERARHWLRLFIERFPKDARAGVSAFTLAGLSSRAVVTPMDRVLGYQRALELSTSAMLREDCYLRLIEAEVLASDLESARSTLAAYRREFPNGRHLATCERLVKGGRPSR